MLSTDYVGLAKEGISAERLAIIFLKEYTQESELSFPVNPFQILKDLGVSFIFRPFKSYDGIYIPCESQEDISVVGINSLIIL